MDDTRAAEAADDPLRPQLLLLMAGAVIGVVLLGAALVIDLTGANDVRTPAVPTMPSGGLPTMPSQGVPTMPNLPTLFPTAPPGATGAPTELPTNLPTNLPSIPQIPGGAP
ncbi:hypothetical protein [Actinomadura fibrosa]|uniref:Uncharacterized protein n=1 Tax=Actinomadura fibrosa TaxID=111802 RepID=A0ABW2Y231_9ACTN|nr:hypothetical protein [Actinomadura fibrosa]